MACKYDHEYKVQAVKLAKEIGGAKAAKELGVPEGTIHTWLKAVRSGKLDIGQGSHTPTSAMSLAEEITMLRKRVKEQDQRENRFFCRMLGVSRQGFYKYLANKDLPWKYQCLAEVMKEICREDECNDTYGRIRMYQALLLKQPEGIHIPSKRTVYRVMDQIGLSHFSLDAQSNGVQAPYSYIYEL